MSDTSEGSAPFGRLDIYGLTDVGRRRSNNEDQFVVASLHKTLRFHQTSLEQTSQLAANQSNAYLLMVADGVGGVGGGEQASEMAVETVSELVAQTTGCYYGFDVLQEDEFLSQLESAVRRANDVIHGSFGGGKGPATTLTMATLVWPRAYFIHIGDSRFYYLHDGRLLQLTQDQTMGAMLVDAGVMDEEEAKRSSLDNVLSSALGGDIDPSIGLVDLDPDDILLLCTDGLVKHVPDEKISEILQNAPNAEVACHGLVDAALDGGGSDNVTVIVGRLAPS
jgi:serine/threonine protein phosphatase PrpC